MAALLGCGQSPRWDSKPAWVWLFLSWRGILAFCLLKWG